MSLSRTVILDTTVLINALRKNPTVRAELRELTLQGVGLAISVVSLAELTAGMRAGEERATDSLISGLECIPVTREIAYNAGLIRGAQRRLGKTLALDDMMIAATAILFGYPLITDNLKDFQVPDLILYRR